MECEEGVVEVVGENMERREGGRLISGFGRPRWAG